MNFQKQDGKKYFEVWGEAFESLQFLKKISLCLLVAVLSLIVLLNRAYQRPPVVIRINEVGRAEPIKDIDTGHHTTKAEVLNFVHIFMRYIMERNFFTLEENLELAKKMMTPELSEKMGKELNSGKEAELIKNGRFNCRLSLSNVEVTRETSGHILISLKGYRRLTSFEDPGFLNETIFEADLSLKKVLRAMETPYGLLAEALHEKIFKNE